MTGRTGDILIVGGGIGGLALALAPLHRAFGIEAVTIVTLQAVSGAGRTGVGAVAMVGNAIPWIPGEEEKFGPELGKILGCDLAVAAAVNRVPVLDGHLAHVFCTLRNPASPDDAARVLREFRPPSAAAALPSVPAWPLVVRTEPDRPQPRLDKDGAGGMAVSVGRIRAAGTPHDLALVVVSHNGVRGAAGACLSNAELCISAGASFLHPRTDSRFRGAFLPGPARDRELPHHPPESHA
jgi:aspartate-semialdehyde dehydrogenase